ncbi:MAG: hypothetical protein M1827_006598 [Pycnora praestabilis]|nr:MAG: hypothetical protein M1827_006598 [Pycnora praestabilis]
MSGIYDLADPETSGDRKRRPLNSGDFWGADEDEEPVFRYKEGGLHPVHLGEVYNDRYKILNKLGSGAFSTVWFAKDTTVKTRRYVALKFKTADEIAEATVTKSRDEKSEIIILKYLKDQRESWPGYQHILSLFDHFDIKGPNGTHHVLATEIVGPSISTVELPPDVIRDMCYQLVEALSFLHQNGIAHGDLHVGNIALEMESLDEKTELRILCIYGSPKCRPVSNKGSQPLGPCYPKYIAESASFDALYGKKIKESTIRHGVLKLIDFGGAFTRENRPNRRLTPLINTAPEVMLYEASSGEMYKDWDLRSDLWSLGCVLKHLIFNYPLFEIIGWGSEPWKELIMTWAWKIGPPPDSWTPYWDREKYLNPDGTLVRQQGWSDETMNSISLKAMMTATDPSSISGTPEELSDLLHQLFVYDPSKRTSARELLSHPWFKSTWTPPSPISSESSTAVVSQSGTTPFAKSRADPNRKSPRKLWVEAMQAKEQAQRELAAAKAEAEHVGFPWAAIKKWLESFRP